MKIYLMTETARLREISEIIEAVDRRCAAADGRKTQDEITNTEFRQIYLLAVGHN